MWGHKLLIPLLLIFFLQRFPFLPRVLHRILRPCTSTRRARHHRTAPAPVCCLLRAHHPHPTGRCKPPRAADAMAVHHPPPRPLPAVTMAALQALERHGGAGLCDMLGTGGIFAGTSAMAAHMHPRRRHFVATVDLYCWNQVFFFAGTAGQGWYKQRHHASCRHNVLLQPMISFAGTGDYFCCVRRRFLLGTGYYQELRQVMRMLEAASDFAGSGKPFCWNRLHWSYNQVAGC